MHSTILQYLEETAENFPDKAAFADVEELYTYKKLVDAAKRIGSSIAEKVSRRSPVVIYMDKRAYNIPAFLGAVYAGCFYAPIDSRMPAERINLILNTLQPGLILYDDKTEKNLDSIAVQTEKLHYQTALDSDINETVLNSIRAAAKNTDLLYVLFTSGSTGIPKGVTISHSAVMDFMEWICDAYQLDETAALCNQAPFYFDASVPDLYIPLKTGATVYIPPQNYYTFPKKVLQYIEENKINTLFWVPSALCNTVNCKALEICAPQSVKLIVFCGEVMLCRHLNVWKKYIPNALYVNMYGPTEAVYACTYYNINREFANDEKLPLGRACSNCGIILLDGDQEITENGVTGEICILGQCLSQGYYNAPEKTCAVFTQSPLHTKWIEYIYRTGDLGYWNEKEELVFAGRKDFQIKRLGHRIELGEIEKVMLSMDELEYACCLFQEDGEEIIAVYAGKAAENEVRKTMSSKLPQYMLPQKYIHLDQMPMNLNGKIDRIKLKQNYTEEH